MDRHRARTRTVERKGASRAKPEQIEVLVIDDEPSVRSLLADALAANRYLVYLADGTNAIAALTARHYHLVISDLKMPVMNGLEALGLAKEKTPEAKLIVITGYPSEESLQSCREMGVARYLVKPFSLTEIRQVARNALRDKPPTVG